MKSISEKSLSNAALFYLRKHSATRKGLEQVLEGKVRRLLREKGGELDAARALIAQVVERMVKTGYVDDARMAESKTASLHRQGKSSRAIQLKLREKGVSAELAKQFSASTPERELEAACMLVKKKRLGVDPSRKQRDLAVLLRAGFGGDVARRALVEGVEVVPAEVCAPVIQLQVSRQSGAPPGEAGQLLQLPLKARPFEPPPPPQEDDFEAACALARKKRLGADPERKQRDLAVLRRAGFSYELGRKALEAQLTPSSAR